MFTSIIISLGYVTGAIVMVGGMYASAHDRTIHIPMLYVGVLLILLSLRLST